MVRPMALGAISADFVGSCQESGGNDVAVLKVAALAGGASLSQCGVI